jgi:hypothetical protein
MTADDVEQIDFIMNWFNFIAVRDAMRATNWKWYQPLRARAARGGAPEEGMALPSEGQLQSCARRLLEATAEIPGPLRTAAVHELGGFRAERLPSGQLRLSFVVEAQEAAEGDRLKLRRKLG